MNFHVKNWFRIGHKLSWKLSWYSLNTLLYFFKPFQSDRRFRTVRKKHEFVFHHLEPIYKQNALDFKDNSNELEPLENKNIWVFWAQGEENAPDIVKLCLRSIRKHAGDATVHVLTKETVRDYIEIPDYMWKQYEQGHMTLAFLTDYMRISLLQKYGGLWLDATILVTKDIPDYVFQNSFFSLHTPYEKTIFVNDNKVHCYVMGGRKGFSLFEYIKDSVETYWKTHDYMVDYYLIDYTIMFGYKTNPEIRKVIDSLEYTPSSLYQIIDEINDPLDEERLLKVEEENIFSKLNWRITPKETVKGKRTNYSLLREQYN